MLPLPRRDRGIPLIPHRLRGYRSDYRHLIGPGDQHDKYPRDNLGVYSRGTLNKTIFPRIHQYSPGNPPP